MMDKLTLQLIVQDEARWMPQCIGFMKKLANSVNGDVQILVVDGGSKDGTLSYIKSVADHRFDIWGRTFTGYADQLNYACSRSNGEWIYQCAADLTATDGIYDNINVLMACSETLTWTFPQIDLMIDTEHAVNRLQWIVNLRRNDSRFSWRGSNDELENLYFEDILIQQHPAHFVLGGKQKVVTGVWNIHFANLKSKEEKLAKYIKRSKLRKSHFYGWDEDKLTTHIMSNPGRVSEDVAVPIEKLIGREVDFYGKSSGY